MLRTTAHAPDLVTTLTFPVDSIQHQQLILILATHLLLTVPVITQRQSWNIIREQESHRYTLQLILATVTLQRYHLIWHTIINEPPATQTSQKMTISTLSNSKKTMSSYNHDKNLLNEGVLLNHNTRWFMSAIGSLPIGEVRSLIPRSK